MKALLRCTQAALAVAALTYATIEGMVALLNWQHDRAIEARCPNTPVVAQSCIDKDGTIELIRPGQTVLIKIRIDEPTPSQGYN